MKSKLILCTLLLITGTSFAQHPFTIKGNLSELEQDVKLTLTYIDKGTYKQESVISKRGLFTFSGDVSKPTHAWLTIDPLQPELASNDEGYIEPDTKEFFIDNSIITIKGGDNIKTASVKGSKTQIDFMSLQAAE